MQGQGGHRGEAERAEAEGRLAGRREWPSDLVEHFGPLHTPASPGPSTVEVSTSSL